MAVDLLLGLQWGDEGKGKIVDVFTSKYDIIARFQGGPNAGHTLEFDGQKHVLHTIPSGIFHKETINLVGNGVVIDPVIFRKELQNLDKFSTNYKTNLLISRKAHLIFQPTACWMQHLRLQKGRLKLALPLRELGQLIWTRPGEMA
jgi:adenylosuccinate synthase